MNQTLTNATQSVLVLRIPWFILVSYFIFRKQNLTSDQLIPLRDTGEYCRINCNAGYEEMIRLVTADLFKFLRRWMPYIILLLFCLYTANSIWNDYYSAKQKLESLSPLTYDDFAAAVEQIAPDEEYVTLVYSSDGVTHRRVLSSDIFDDAVLPEYIHWMFGNLNNYLYLCLPFVILAASFIGTEYKWGTLRQTLARGIGRNAYFGSKYVSACHPNLAVCLHSNTLLPYCRNGNHETDHR